MANSIIRYMRGDYIGKTDSALNLLGFGVVQLDENPTATIDSTAFINDKSVSGTVTGYANVFPFDAQIVSDEAAIMDIYEIGRNQKTGADAQRTYIAVDLYASPTTNTSYPARKFIVSVEVSGVTGAGTNVMHVTGNLHQVGNFVEGMFDTSTKTFTAS